MEDNNKICTCTTPEYTINLNKQGPPGVKGDTGENGFSPQISVLQQDNTTYVLSIITSEGQIITPNLQGAGVPSNGSYGQYLMSNGGSNSQWVELPTAQEGQQGIIAIADEDDLTSSDNTTAITPAIFNNQLKTQFGNYIVAGNNITTSVGEDGKVTINSTAEPFTLPQATSTTLGGIKVGENLSITEDGTLSATGGVTEIPQANATTLGGIKANEKQDIDTQEVRIDTTTGLLYTQPGSVPDIIDGGNANTTSVIPQPIDNYSSNDAISETGYVATDEVTIQEGG